MAVSAKKLANAGRVWLKGERIYLSSALRTSPTSRAAVIVACFVLNPWSVVTAHARSVVKHVALFY